MSYVEDTIGTNEKIVYAVKLYWIYTVNTFLYLLFLGVFVVGIIIFIKMMINRWTTERVLTDYGYIQKNGLIPRDIDEISIYKIEEVDLSQTLFGRILGYGSISISGNGSCNIFLKAINEHLIFQKHLNDLRFNNQSQ